MKQPTVAHFSYWFTEQDKFMQHYKYSLIVQTRFKTYSYAVIYLNINIYIYKYIYIFLDIFYIYLSLEKTKQNCPLTIVSTYE